MWFSFMYTLPYARDFMSTEFNNKLKWGCTYRYTVHQLAKINSYLPTNFSLHVKRNHLIKNLALCSSVFFHNFNFEFSKRLISQFGSCVGSNKRVKNSGPGHNNMNLKCAQNVVKNCSKSKFSGFT